MAKCPNGLERYSSQVVFYIKYFPRKHYGDIHWSTSVSVIIKNISTENVLSVNSNITTHTPFGRWIFFSNWSANKNIHSCIYMSPYNYMILLYCQKMTYFSGITMVSGQAISVPKLKEVKNEYLHAGSCIVSSSGQSWRQQREQCRERGECVMANNNHGSFLGDHMMLGKVFWL